MTRRCCIAVALVTVAACGAPTAPTPSGTSSAGTPAAPTVALPGVWSGYLKATDCPSGYPCNPEELVPFILRVAAQGSTYAAALEVTGASNSVVMDVTGASQPYGAVLFTGQRGEIDSDQATVELRRLLVREGDSHIAVSGTATGSALQALGAHALAPAACKAGWDDGTYCLIEFTLSVTADALDRLSGSITYRVEGVDYRNRPFAFSAVGTLDGLVRWP